MKHLRRQIEADVKYHKMLNGVEIDYSLPDERTRIFLDRVRRAAEDIAVTEAMLVQLIWSSENPLLVSAPPLQRGMATPETYANPVWWIMRDYEDRKRAQFGSLHPLLAQERFSLTVSEAADQIGITPSAIRQAIQAGKLTAVKRNGVYFLDPDGVGRYYPSGRGPKTTSKPLYYHKGKTREVGFQVRVEGVRPMRSQVYGRGAHEKGQIPSGWSTIHILEEDRQKQSRRYLRLEPSHENRELSFRGYGISGPFRIGDEVAAPADAVARWRARTG